MSFFEEVMARVFGKQLSKTALIHEVLTRSEKEVASFHLWENSEDRKDLIHEVQHAYYMKRQGISSSLEVHLLESKYSNGFAISYHSQIGVENFKHLFDFLKLKVLENKYKLAQGDRRVIPRDRYVESIEKWYLKPETEGESDGTFNQRFGNVLIEKVEIDGNPSYIKFMANLYQDRQYTEAKPFQGLLDIVFES